MQLLISAAVAGALLVDFDGACGHVYAHLIDSLQLAQRVF
jgi:hypothetical protein